LLDEEVLMLALLAILAACGAGFANAPWWFWLVAALVLAVLGVTDPSKVHPRYADGGLAEVLVVNSLASFSTGCVGAALAFAVGRCAALLLLP
jgi:hypothetical protein